MSNPIPDYISMSPNVSWWNPHNISNWSMVLTTVTSHTLDLQIGDHHKGQKTYSVGFVDKFPTCPHSNLHSVRWCPKHNKGLCLKIGYPWVPHIPMDKSLIFPMKMPIPLVLRQTQHWSSHVMLLHEHGSRRRHMLHLKQPATAATHRYRDRNMDNLWRSMSMCTFGCVWEILNIKDMQFSTLKCRLFVRFGKSINALNVGYQSFLPVLDRKTDHFGNAVNNKTVWNMGNLAISQSKSKIISLCNLSY